MKSSKLLKYLISGLSTLLLILLTFQGCGTEGSFVMNGSRQDGNKPVNIRLLSVYGTRAIAINTLGACKIVNAETKAQFMALKSGELRFACAEKCIAINESPVTATRINVIPEGGMVKIEGSEYRGLAEISLENGALSVINELSIEELIMSQVGREMGAEFSPEALKAQAITARTFVLYEKNRSKFKSFDLKNLPGDGKIYYGTAVEHNSGIAAVEATKGITLKYQGETAFTPYFSNCGGYTEDVTEVWGSASKEPYLIPVPCFFCKNGEHYTWQTEIAKSHIIATLNASGRGCGDVYEIDPNYEVTKGGRTKTVSISTDRGKITLALNDFRSIVGYNVLMSARALTCRPRAATFYFTGKGWGHGVGMCQDGANGMAKQGHSYKEILRRYYPGTEIASR